VYKKEKKMKEGRALQTRSLSTLAAASSPAFSHSLFFLFPSFMSLLFRDYLWKLIVPFLSIPPPLDIKEENTRNHSTFQAVTFSGLRVFLEVNKQVTLKQMFYLCFVNNGFSNLCNIA